MTTLVDTADLPEPDEDAFLASIRIDQQYTDAAVGVVKPLMTVPVRKPAKTEFFRAHRTCFTDCLVIELKTENETYLVHPLVQQELAEFAVPVRLRLCVNRAGTAFVWPIKLPVSETRPQNWMRSAADAASLAIDSWTRLSADMNLGAYQAHVALGDLGEPRWPTEPWAQVVKIAFRDRFIDSVEHVIVKQLRGQL